MERGSGNHQSSKKCFRCGTYDITDKHTCYQVVIYDIINILPTATTITLECWKDEDEISNHPQNASVAVHMTLLISIPAIKLLYVISLTYL